MQGWLKNWIGRLLRFFWNLKPAKISKNDTNIICLSSKNTLIFKITRTRLKNWALHAHFNFEIQFIINRSILELKTSSSGFKLLRYRVKNVVFTAKLLLQWFVRNFRKTDFVFWVLPPSWALCPTGCLNWIDKIGFS